MKNLELFGVQELEKKCLISVEGGVDSISEGFGYVIGAVVGTAFGFIVNAGKLAARVI
ncbi:hypothetical protein JM83_1602 [Gillisia sp. Hel_I_86]|uniref:hypothetical protein n=1 Tax=Gillisia sp. Hel_I_86 TaxID=1249981 RepID=UPI00119AF049|nr:hypothetical protein [Gillisia sp. Hel_I_86]TVZ26622.1 hypothetical protein JM83_1602 [Gillisia sp. Hel_I_86]